MAIIYNHIRNYYNYILYIISREILWARQGESMANGWALNSMLERLKTELDATVQFWLQYSHDKECGSVFVPYRFSV